MPDASKPAGPPRKRSTASYFFLRGLAIILPPVLTLVILLWAANAFNTYVIQPVNLVVRYAVAKVNNDIRLKTDKSLIAAPPGFPRLPDWRRDYRITQELADEAERNGPPDVDSLLSDRLSAMVYVPMGKGSEPGNYVQLRDYDLVFKHLRPTPLPSSAIGLYMEIASDRYFAWELTAVALSITIIALYFLGRFVTAKLGAWFVHKFEFLLTRVPLVRNVYSTVKQVTDFVISDREVEFKRVVALEYPRQGSWTLGFVTGDGMLECAAAVGEPLVTVLVATSPMPMGGFTIMVPRSQVVDLDLTVDQALQFIVSCGVLIPPAQRSTPELLEKAMQKRVGVCELATSGAAVATGDNGNRK